MTIWLFYNLTICLFCLLTIWQIVYFFKFDKKIWDQKRDYLTIWDFLRQKRDYLTICLLLKKTEKKFQIVFFQLENLSLYQIVTFSIWKFVILSLKIVNVTIWQIWQIGDLAICQINKLKICLFSNCHFFNLTILQFDNFFSQFD